MKTVIPCDVSGCGYIARHSSPVVAKRMIGVHKRKKHGIKGVSSARNEKYGSKKKRKYTKRRPVVHEDSSLAQPVENLSHGDVVISRLVDEFKFCPKCGYNFERHLLAIMIIMKNEKS